MLQSSLRRAWRHHGTQGQQASRVTLSAVTGASASNSSSTFQVRTFGFVPSSDDAPLSPEVIDLVTSSSNSIPPLSLASHPFDGVCHMFEYIHTMTDVPYCGAIVIGTVAVRTCLLPLTVSIMKNGAKMQIVAPEIEKFKKLLEENKLSC